jgi:hypothetical protein
VPPWAAGTSAVGPRIPRQDPAGLPAVAAPQPAACTAWAAGVREPWIVEPTAGESVCLHMLRDVVIDLGEVW